MKARLAWLLQGLLLLLPAGGLAAGSAQGVRVVAFVGRLESIERSTWDPCAGNLNCVTMDLIYDATYTVLAPLQGRIGTGPIQLRIFDHYGFPEVARHRHALLFVYVTDDAATLVKYTGYEMLPLAQGGWGSCGNPSARVELESQPLQFAPEVNFGSVANLSEAAIAREFEPEYFDIRDGLAYCRKGVTAAALAEALYPELLQELRKQQAEEAAE